MPITLERTQRGFSIGYFLDRNGDKCSIQKSSLAFEPEECIWRGTGDIRMHLTQSMAADLIPLLTRFVETGELEIPDGT